jgi:hypothetical protein
MQTQSETLTGANDQAGVQEFIKEVYQRAATLANQGKSKANIQTELLTMGLNQENASLVVANVFRLRKKAHREAGTKNIVIGALWCVGGIVVTAATYQMASGGGTYVVAWGAILFGGIQSLRGLCQVAINLL